MQGQRLSRRSKITAQEDPPFRDSTPSRNGNAITADKLNSPDIWQVPQMIADSFQSLDTQQGSIAKMMGSLADLIAVDDEPISDQQDTRSS